MTFSRLLLAGLPVAVWFALVAAARWFARGRAAPEGTPPQPHPFSRAMVGWLLAESAAVTLFGSLWFDSLGSGAWWLVFGLVGFLVGFPGRWSDGLVDVARYIGAGGLLALALS